MIHRLVPLSLRTCLPAFSTVLCLLQSSYDPRTRTLSDVAGREGDSGFVDGPGLVARFSWPRGITVMDREQCAYISDNGNHRIRRLTLPPEWFR